jgi:hypothetical protein
MKKVSWLISGGVVLMIIMSGLIYRVWIGSRVEIPFALSVGVGLYALSYILVNPFSVFLNSTGNVRILVITAPLTILTFAACCYFYTWIFHSVVSIPLAMVTANVLGLLAQAPVLRKTLQSA